MTTWIGLLPELKMEILLHALNYKSLGCMLKSVRRLKRIDKESYGVFTNWFTWKCILARFGYTIDSIETSDSRFNPISILFNEVSMDKSDLETLRTWKYFKIPDKDIPIFPEGEVFMSDNYLINLHEKVFYLYGQSLDKRTPYNHKIANDEIIDIRETSIGLMLITTRNKTSVLCLFTAKATAKIWEIEKGVEFMTYYGIFVAGVLQRWSIENDKLTFRSQECDSLQIENSSLQICPIRGTDLDLVWGGDDANITFTVFDFSQSKPLWTGYCEDTLNLYSFDSLLSVDEHIRDPYTGMSLYYVGYGNKLSLKMDNSGYYVWYSDED